ncbi:hypothetical protein [Flavobacterium johnsoniae]|uniref:DUF3823 domain-containing protein n=1 Tax=Flavobacterium johnsoniae TaxID=986 RepID=A0A1J7CG32_FLAJO|nr:hypothetical protein [Flavobacterium johnsoniae]OIV40500.1 hypothetical protein BKM63_16585 [Flavobacterium johnsoniae]
MKKIISILLALGAVLFVVASCSNDDLKYDSYTVKSLDYQLNGAPWNLNVGISTRPLFIYKDDGNYFANYSSLYPFSLESGKYKLVASDVPEQMIPMPVNLNELIVPQPALANQHVNLSDAVPYASPFEEPVTLNIITRTGTLRLKSSDITADKSYTTIKTTVSVKRSGYKVSDGTYVKEDMFVTRSKATANGGINYTDDFVLFQTGEEANNVRVKIECLDQNMQVVKTKELEGTFPIEGSKVTDVSFLLNEL